MTLTWISSPPCTRMANSCGYVLWTLRKTSTSGGGLALKQADQLLLEMRGGEALIEAILGLLDVLVITIGVYALAGFEISPAAFDPGATASPMCPPARTATCSMRE